MAQLPSDRIPFNFACGSSSLAMSPPFDFDHVVVRVFPLRAGMYGLRQFCDRYLTMDQPFHRFEPSLPFVYLLVINYGRMGAQASNLGWVSQNEITFAVPLSWKERPGDWEGPDDDRWVHRGWAVACPFIFVDEESSVRTGREVYGWAKSLARLSPDVDEWTRDPRSDQTLLRLDAKIFPELFAARRQEFRTLVEIERDPPPAVVELPPDPFNPLNPLLSLPRAMLESTRLAGDLVQFLAGLPIHGYSPDRRLRDVIRLPAAGAGFLDRLPAVHTVNLKQFRASEDPQNACYQALTDARMQVNCFHRGGLLGDLIQLRGDPSGGYRVKLHRYDAWPIVGSLGLEVAEELQQDDHTMAVLKPVCPFWVDVDLEYGHGEVLCWQSRLTEWTRPPDRPAPRSTPTRFSFNTAEGGSLDQVAGPFTFPDVTHRVLPLLADRRKLQTFCDAYLNHIDEAGESTLPRTRFEAWGKYVYLVATSFKEVSSDTASLGWWADRQVAFYVPVRRFTEVPIRGFEADYWDFPAGTRRTLDEAGLGTVRKVAQADASALEAAGLDGATAKRLAATDFSLDQWRLESVALVAPYMFADSDVATTAGREVQGWPMVKATLESPPSRWMEPGGPSVGPAHLTLKTAVLPALNTNSRIEERVLLEIIGRDVLPSYRAADWSSVAQGWGHEIIEQMERDRSAATASERLPPSQKVKVGRLDHLKTLAIELLALRRPFNVVALKQFLDAGKPRAPGDADACYQAVTLSAEKLSWLYDLEEIDERLHVALHHYPTYPIVDTLGLTVKWTDSTRETRVDYLQPLRPFWLRCAIRTDLAREILSRSGTGWHLLHRPDGYFARSHTGGTRQRPIPGAELCEQIDRRGQDLKSVAVRWEADLARRGRLSEELGQAMMLGLVDHIESFSQVAGLIEKEPASPLAAALRPLQKILDASGEARLPEVLEELFAWYDAALAEFSDDAVTKATLRGLALAASTTVVVFPGPYPRSRSELRQAWKWLALVKKSRGEESEAGELADWVEHSLGSADELVDSMAGLEKLPELAELTLEEAVAAVDLEPQLAVQSILSHWWGRAIEPGRETRPCASDFILRADSIGNRDVAEAFRREHGLEPLDENRWCLPARAMSAPARRRRAFVQAAERPVEQPTDERWSGNYRAFVSFVAHLQKLSGASPVRFEDREVAEWLGVRERTAAGYRTRAIGDGLLTEAEGGYRFALRDFPELTAE